LPGREKKAVEPPVRLSAETQQLLAIAGLALILAASFLTAFGIIIGAGN
jgi:hypothetical protein